MDESSDTVGQSGETAELESRVDLFGWREGQSQVGASPWSALLSDFLVSYHLVCSAAKLSNI